MQGVIPKYLAIYNKKFHFVPIPQISGDKVIITSEVHKTRLYSYSTPIDNYLCQSNYWDGVTVRKNRSVVTRKKISFVANKYHDTSLLFVHLTP